jgi:UDP-N-acetylglucosamine 2-epimerase (non-hydrolysing)
MIKMLFIFGTRPEAIKLAPLIKECQKRDTEFKVLICVTAQHRGMLDQVLDFFAITPDFDLDIMKKNQRLSDLTSQCLLGLDGVLTAASPDLIIVQGDTTTAFVGALCGYYHAIKVAHIEAGLRSLNKYAPFPEEMNRILAGRLADYHFAPTETAAQNLRAEGITKDVWTVGNTVIDALFLGLEMIRYRGGEEFVKHFNFLDFSKRIILVTCHRRESFGAPLERLCMAFKTIAAQNPDMSNRFSRPFKPASARTGNENPQGLSEYPSYRTFGLSPFYLAYGSVFYNINGFRRRSGRSSLAWKAGFGDARSNRKNRRCRGGNSQTGRNKSPCHP